MSQDQKPLDSATLDQVVLVMNADPFPADCNPFIEYPTLTPSSAPRGITVGADGVLWFTESSNTANRIGRITTSSSETEFSTGITANATPYGNHFWT